MVGGLKGAITSLSFNSKKRLLAVSYSDRVVFVDTNRWTRQLVLFQKESVNDLAISPDNSILAVANRRKELRYISILKNKKKFELIGHTDSIIQVVFSMDGKLIASVGLDGRVIIWDYKKEKNQTSFHESRAFGQWSRDFAKY